MARTPAGFRSDIRIGEHISIGLLAKAFPLQQVKEALRETGKESIRERDLPAHVVVYYVLAMTLFMHVSYEEVLRCLLEGLQWVFGPNFSIIVPGKSGISQARTRLGHQPLQKLHDELVKPVAVKRTKGAWYRNWLIVSIDGSSLDLQDTPANAKEFGRPQCSETPRSFPQLRFVALIECGTRVIFGARMGGYRTSELALAKEVLSFLKPGMLCIADRYYLGFELWKQARETGADLLWRARKDMIFKSTRRLKDGSSLSVLYPSIKDRKNKTNGIPVRIIDYKLKGPLDAETTYRLVTSILEEDRASAKELAALYHERWEIETALDEVKTHLRGPRIVLRSKTPDLVRQEFFGLLMTHFAIRGLMHEAAIQTGEDPDELSYTHSVRVIRRKLPQFAAFSPNEQKALHQTVINEILCERRVSSRNRHNQRGVKRNPDYHKRRFPIKPLNIRFNYRKAIKISRKLLK